MVMHSNALNNYLFVLGFFTLCTLCNHSSASSARFSEAHESSAGKFSINNSGFAEFAYNNHQLNDKRGELNVYLDGAQVDASICAEVFFDSTLDETSKDWCELFLAIELNHNLTVTAGRQTLEWGKSEFFYVNDFVAKDWYSFFAGRSEADIPATIDAVVLAWNSWHSLGTATGKHPVSIELAWIPASDANLSQENEYMLQIKGQQKNWDWAAFAYKGGQKTSLFRAFETVEQILPIQAYGLSLGWNFQSTHVFFEFNQQILPAETNQSASLGLRQSVAAGKAMFTTQIYMSNEADNNRSWLGLVYRELALPSAFTFSAVLFKSLNTDDLFVKLEGRFDFNAHWRIEAGSHIFNQFVAAQAVGIDENPLYWLRLGYHF
ncbi:hypothetical protein [Catenovulum sediminis]|uniref:Porin n=1 Tax=Catenovulum sediminis TaxID=1740262 RepID=A0ABV1RD40_9ALTE|nr:hypothetical protein [Catenovulum sediminis]